MITQERLKEALYYDPEIGIFTWLISGVGSAKAGVTAGYRNDSGYILLEIDCKAYRVHRLAWFYTHGEWPIQIDHINHIKNDNRLINLRSVTHRENGINQSIHSSNTSGITGVCWCKSKNKWIARIHVHGKQCNLGAYKDKFEAICARKSAEFKYGFHENHGR